MPAALDPDCLRSLVAIAETGSFTAAGERVHRTQSAVSMQMRRLESQLGQKLFQKLGREARLTPEGLLLLGHARRILKAQSEALAAFDRQALDGEVTIAAPDDYAASFLPGILVRFAAHHPRVRVNLLSLTSNEANRRVERGEIDLALVTQGHGETGGVVLHREPLVWVGAVGQCAQDEDPLPLAVFHDTCSFRRHAIEALDAVGRGWRIAYTNQSIAGVFAAVETGLAVGTILASNLRPGLQVLGAADGLPALPEVTVLMVRRPDAASSLLDALAEHVAAGVATALPQAHAA
ncbi:MAG: LysR substrate-binding domain-containing protein [Geminicoccaceae bacterium]